MPTSQSVTPPRLHLWLWTAAIAGLHLLAAAFVPLSYDEAYYHQWSAAPALGYFDHPPFVAWAIRAGTALLGHGPLGIRLFFVLATLAAGLAAARLARGWWDEATALRAFLWFNASLLIGAAGHLASPDTPLVLFWTLAIAALARTAGGEGRWWLAAGLFCGLAVQSKYTGFFLGPGLLLWLALDGRLGAELRRPWIWAAGLVALAAAAPNLLWNAAHGWATFDKQFGRVGGHGWRPGFLAELLLTQAVLFGPLILPFLWRGLRLPGPGPRLVIATALPLVLYMLLHSLHDRVQGNWPAPLYPALAVLAAAGAAAPLARGRRWARRLAAAATALGLAVGALADLHLAWPATDVFGPRDPVKQFRDWAPFAAGVRDAAARAQAGWIGTVSYSTAARLAYEMPAGPPVRQVDEPERYTFLADPGVPPGPGLVLDLDRRLRADDLTPCFAQVDPLGTVDRTDGRHVWGRYAAFRVDGFKPGCLDANAAQEGAD